MDSASRFLRRRPFRDLTVTEVMAGTPLSRPAFYAYFTDLHDLIESLLGEVEAVMHETAHPWVSGEGEPIAALRESQRGVVQTCVDHGPIFRAVAEAAPLDERLETTWSAFTKRWDEVVEARIRAQQAEGLIPKSLDAKRIAHALNTMDTALLVAEFGRRPYGDPEAVLDTMHDVWSRTLYGERRAAVPARKRSRRTRS